MELKNAFLEFPANHTSVPATSPAEKIGLLPFGTGD
jgi:hypothetical protein